MRTMLADSAADFPSSTGYSRLLYVGFSSRRNDCGEAKQASCGDMKKKNDQSDDGGGVQVQCVETPDGELIVNIRTLTDEELDRLLRIPRRAPKRVH
jgi:hypothetical protein